MAFSQDRATQQREGYEFAVPVAGSTVIYAGSIVAVNSSGYAVPASDTAGLKVLGMAIEQVDNSDGADGAKQVVIRRCRAFLLKGSSLSQANVGGTVYAVDDETVAASGTTNSIAVGKLLEIVSSTAGWVWID